MKLFFREFGQGNSVKLIVLHGLFGSSDNWLTISKQFALHYHVFLLDIRNHGQSPHTQEHNYTLIAQDLEEFITQHRLDNIVLMGHSMGGKAVLKYLSLYSRPILKAIIVDIAPRYYEPHHQAYIKAMQGLQLENIQSRQEVEQAFIEQGINHIGERQFLMKNLYRDENGKFGWKINIDVLIRDIENIGECIDTTLHPNLNILFIKGEKSDYYIKESDQIEIKRLYPKAQIATVKNAGHWVQAEQPQAFFELVRGFVG